jgi:hypothetical protein
MLVLSKEFHRNDMQMSKIGSLVTSSKQLVVLIRSVKVVQKIDYTNT